MNWGSPIANTQQAIAKAELAENAANALTSLERQGLDDG